MNVGDILRQSWRITWGCWPLWALNATLLLVFVPTFMLGGAFGGAAALVSVPIAGAPPNWLIEFRQIPAWAWAVITVMALGLLVLLTAASWMLQAAAIRGAAMAAEHGTFRLSEALHLGWGRTINIFKLSVTFGLLVAALALLPPVVAILLARRFEIGFQWVQFAQSALAPLNTALGLALFLVMMSVALEDLAPRAAFRRAWKVFRFGWWGFALVLGITALPAILIVLLVVPLAVVVLIAFFVDFGWVLLLACCGVIAPIGVGLMLFTAVFTVVLYTLMYRAAAQLTGPKAAPTQ